MITVTKPVTHTFCRLFLSINHFLEQSVSLKSDRQVFEDHLLFSQSLMDYITLYVLIIYDLTKTYYWRYRDDD